jgi:hypothetical protein
VSYGSEVLLKTEEEDEGGEELFFKGLRKKRIVKTRRRDADTWVGRVAIELCRCREAETYESW